MPSPKGLSMAEAKEGLLREVAKGVTIEAALGVIGRSRKSYENWRAADPSFARQMDEIREARQNAKNRGTSQDDANLDFETWRKRYLKRDTYSHQRMWIDLLEGREPQELHDAMTYNPGRKERVLINTPPFHAKSTVITQEYVAYRICMNPNVRICIVSKTQSKAKKFLHSIKRMLTGIQYTALQVAYAPEGGFKDKDSSWTATQIYVAGRTEAEKDPTVEVLGIRGDIYGGRYDLIILDDCVTKENVGEFSNQLDWINQEVVSRLFGGKLLVVGTRVASVDLYSELRNPDNFASGKSNWTYLAQPAVLQFGDTPEEWQTLWPKSNSPLDEEDPGEPDANGQYRAWDGPNLSAVRDGIRLSTWSLVYMQQQVPEDSVFNPVCVRGSIERRRKPGVLTAGSWGHPRHGLEGQYVIASMDPAMSGDTFTLVGAVERSSQMRRIMNCWVKTAPSPAYIRELIAEVTDAYQVNEWVIEQNAFQLFLVHDEEIRRFCSQRGVRITPHYTSRNKQDPDFGVASVAPLFGSVKQHDAGHRKGMDHNGDNLIELPDQAGSEGVKALIEQLITWQPGKLGKQLKQDGPMALWFFELRARAILGVGRTATQKNFLDNPYLSRSDRARQATVPVEALRFAAMG